MPDVRLCSALGSLLLFSCAAAEPLPAGWHRIDLGPFSMTLPTELKSVPVRAIDSYVGEFAAPEMKIHFDYGDWSDPLTSSYGEVLAKEKIRISDREALVVTWRRTDGSPSPILSAVHFPARWKEDALLTVYADLKEEAAVGSARRIFDSIRFR
jgi:hypothetical protein